jgi:hypothetical protein
MTILTCPLSAITLNFTLAGICRIALVVCDLPNIAFVQNHAGKKREPFARYQLTKTHALIAGFAHRNHKYLHHLSMIESISTSNPGLCIGFIRIVQ